MEPLAAAGEQDASSVRRRGIGKIIVVGCLLLLLAGVLVGYILWDRPVPTLPPLPDPNGYDDLVAAGEMISQVPDDVGAADQATLEAFLDRNHGALERGRLGLSRDCCVPVEFNQQSMTVLIDRGSQVRKLARLFSTEGRLAELRQRPGKASASYLDLVRLGYVTRNGGLIVTHLVGIACATSGLESLRGLVPELQPAECERLIKQLQTMESHAEPLADLLDREEQFAQNAYGLWGVYAQFTNPQLMSRTQEQTEQAVLRATTQLHLLLGHLALKMYHEANGTYPDDLSVLTPQFLESVPLDAFTGQPLVYQLEDDGYRLYSVGPDRTDDGGVPLSGSPSANERPGDVVLEIEESSNEDNAKSATGAAQTEP